MKKQILTEEFRRMQVLAGLITEAEAKAEVSPEQAVDSVSKVSTKIENDPKIDAFAASIANDPKKKQELLDLSKKLGINPLNLNEGIEDPSEKLALIFAKKAKNEINEYSDNEDVTAQAMGALSGFFAGGFFAPYLAEKLQMFTTTYVNTWGETLTNPEGWVPFAGMAAGAIAGWVLGAVIKKVFEN
jgi:hypothetical protein